MKKYDWLMLAFRVFFKAYQIKEVQDLVAALKDTELDGKAKRDHIINHVCPAVEGSGRYVMKALIEVALAKLVETDSKK